MSSMQTTPLSPVDGPPEKTKKYDRQLRLWGDHGQTALESAKICMVNATATGTEILKNLILPGIGSFTLVDGHKVTGEDVGNNFFLDRKLIGQSRAQAATEFLLELNEDVDGDFIEESVDVLLDNNPEFFNNFSLVIVTQLPERSLLRLANTLWEADIPLLICRSYGFIGYIRLVTREHAIIESHPDNVIEDLRLDCPFPGLIKFCDSLELQNMDLKMHSHTPWLVILYKYLQQWKQEHNGQPPKSYKEKNGLRDLLRTGIRRKENGCLEEEENFEEAIRNVNTALLPTKVPEDIENIFQDECCNELHSESKPFWILARAVKEFKKNAGQGHLPLRGTIPDMTADSERYVQLQNVYREQAKNDISIVTNHVQTLLQSIGRDEPLTIQKNTRSPASSPGKPQDHITDDDIKTFCKNAGFLRVVRCRSLGSEYDSTTFKSSELASRLEDCEEEEDVIYYVLLRAVDRFYSEWNRYPGYYADTTETDIPQLKSAVNKLLQEWCLPQCIKDDYIHEFCRYGASELHSVASFIGGTAAQESIKLITGQFLPINNTFIYNAMRQTSVTIKL